MGKISTTAVLKAARRILRSKGCLISNSRGAIDSANYPRIRITLRANRSTNHFRGSKVSARWADDCRSIPAASVLLDKLTALRVTFQNCIVTGSCLSMVQIPGPTNSSLASLTVSIARIFYGELRTIRYSDCTQRYR